MASAEMPIAAVVTFLETLLLAKVLLSRMFLGHELPDL